MNRDNYRFHRYEPSVAHVVAHVGWVEERNPTNLSNSSEKLNRET